MRNSRWASWLSWFATSTMTFRDDKLFSARDCIYSLLGKKKVLLNPAGNEKPWFWDSDQSQSKGRLMSRFCDVYVHPIWLGVVCLFLVNMAIFMQRHHSSCRRFWWCYISAIKLWTWWYCWWFKHSANHLDLACIKPYKSWGQATYQLATRISFISCVDDFDAIHFGRCWMFDWWRLRVSFTIQLLVYQHK